VRLWHSSSDFSMIINPANDVSSGTVGVCQHRGITVFGMRLSYLLASGSKHG
jgi:hypothetical protein